ncbi:uncharacterized protein Hap1MRO34_018496 [Clarias gariepinus]
MPKRKRVCPMEDATTHILSGRDKPCLEKGFINTHKGAAFIQRNRAVPHSGETPPSEEETPPSEEETRPPTKPTEQIGSIVSESRPSKSDQCTDCNSDPAFTASDMMENHSQRNRAVPHSGETPPSEEETPPSEEETRPPTKPTEQVHRFVSRLNRLRQHHDKCAQRYEQLLTTTRETESGDWLHTE